eukprot:scaffold518072_cov42-Prasinocladus_malaysianus.AAC.1
MRMDSSSSCQLISKCRINCKGGSSEGNWPNRKLPSSVSMWMSGPKKQAGRVPSSWLKLRSRYERVSVRLAVDGKQGSWLS